MSVGRASTSVVRTIALGVALGLMPASAYAVNVSSGSGSGTQSRVVTYSNGAKVDGELRSTQGNRVYYQGRVDLGGCNDVTVGRYSSNTTSTSDVDRGGTISTIRYLCSFQGVRSKICRDISGAPDLCGSWSNRY